MKVLWLVNYMIPNIAQKLGKNATVNEGWISGMANMLAKKESILLHICYPQSETTQVFQNQLDGITYLGYPRKKDNRSYDSDLHNVFAKILNEVKPDVIHIMGTEFPHCYSMMEASKQCDLLHKTVISIQGLVSVCAKHYLNTVPVKVRYRMTIRDILKQENMLGAARKLSDRGVFEEKSLMMSCHVIGRTDWDYACTQLLAPNAKYHFNNENLRGSFYSDCWSYEDCEKHSIFFSQATNPIKGLHIMLDALTIVKKRYPDVRLYCAGLNISGLPFYKRSSYGQYLKDLIDKNALKQNVHFTGPLKELEMKKRFLKSNVFVSASLIENSPNSVGEAMILGVPCITSDVGGVKNLLKHGEEGYIYQTDAPYMLAHYICNIFGKEDNVKDFAVKARKHALMTHDREKNANQLENIYMEISEG